MSLLLFWSGGAGVPEVAEQTIIDTDSIQRPVDYVLMGKKKKSYRKSELFRIQSPQSKAVAVIPERFRIPLINGASK